MSPKPIKLDGRTLEGGGQLVRIALALSSITTKPITISHIRNNRQGKKGLKASHLAAVNFLAHITGSAVSGAEVGSTTLSFCPSSVPLLPQPEYNIKLDTAGAVFLVFQAVYPYLLYVGREKIRLNLTGGTNVAFALSYDYIAQVLSPNFERLGLPRLEVGLQKRGWSRGPVDLGRVTVVVHPLTSDREDAEFATNRIPSIRLDGCHRGKITRIDITVLAPDIPVDVRFSESTFTSRSKKRNKENQRPEKNGFHQTNKKERKILTARQFLETETFNRLYNKLSTVPLSRFQTTSTPPTSTSRLPSPQEEHETIVPVALHTSERTYHPQHMYVMIVAHTSTGFRLGRDALFGALPTKIGKDRSKRSAQPIESKIEELASHCVDGFIEEIYDPHIEEDTRSEKVKPCVDQHMRDQVVIFEALGRASRKEHNPTDLNGEEDERHWTLHTRTAQWVCEQMLS